MRGGFWGILFGAIAGDWVERQIRSHASARRENAATEEWILLTLLSSMMAKLAKADGRVSEDEIRCCTAIFDRYGITGEKRAHCIRAFRHAKDDARSIHDYAAVLVRRRRSTAVRLVVYDILWDVAAADGHVAEVERRLLEELTRSLEIDASYYVWQCHRRGLAGGGTAAASEPDPYAVLGADETATDAELRRAYREKAKRLHPDVLRAQGLSEELLGRANEQMARLNAAWDQVRRARGL